MSEGDVLRVDLVVVPDDDIMLWFLDRKYVGHDDQFDVVLDLCPLGSMRKIVWYTHGVTDNVGADVDLIDNMLHDADDGFDAVRKYLAPIEVE